MVPKTDGRKVVAVAFAGIATMVGISTIWLPFFSDRDKIRGMAEDENMTEEERFQVMREMSMQLSRERSEGHSEKQKQHPNSNQGFSSGLQGEHSNQSSGSMWKNMTQSRGR